MVCATTRTQPRAWRAVPARLVPPAGFPPAPPSGHPPSKKKGSRAGGHPLGRAPIRLSSLIGRRPPPQAAPGCREPLRHFLKPPLCPPHGQRHPRRMEYHAPPRVPLPCFGGDEYQWCAQAHPTERVIHPRAPLPPASGGRRVAWATAGGVRARFRLPRMAGKFPRGRYGLPLLFRARSRRRIRRRPPRGRLSPNPWPRLL
jgi:hypothetical protein